MSAKFYVHKAKADANLLRRRLQKLGHDCRIDVAFDIRTIAEVYLGCQIVSRRGLSDRSALEYLRSEYGIDISRVQPDEASLAGGLYLTADGVYRWIFLEQGDAISRQRFTLAHETAHLVLEAEPALLNRRMISQSVFEEVPKSMVLTFGRCPPAALDSEREKTATQGPGAESRRRSSPQEASLVGPSEIPSKRIRPPLTATQLREIVANHFAAELLLPYDGIRQVLATHDSGQVGIRTPAELQTVANALADIYQVSVAAARLRLTKDLGIIPLSNNPNPDLFA